MKIYSNNIQNGYLQDAFGSRGTAFIQQKKPSRSFHIAWKDLPASTKSLALAFVDYDAIPVCGFCWIHWTAANIDPALGELPENASLTQTLLQGVTSWSSPIIPKDWALNKADDAGYGGCAPPDQAHLYTLKVYALDTKLDVKTGFYLNELRKAMEGHIVGKAKLNMLYQPGGK